MTGAARGDESYLLLEVPMKVGVKLAGGPELVKIGSEGGSRSEFFSGWFLCIEDLRG